MRILVTGGSGYIGTMLVIKLLAKNYKVLSIDKKIFGDKLIKHKNLKNLKMSVGELNQKLLKKIDAVIHLAAISNDPAALLNSKITWETNVLETLHLLNICKLAKIKHFIFASSGSVYGISKKLKVSEKTNLLPITDYNKTKMVGEKLVLNFSKFYKTTILRPGTVCGYSDNIRLDLTVNAMTYSALTQNKVVVNGGSQIRPQLHIDDMIDCYLFVLRKKIVGVFNVGFENYPIIKIAQLIKKNLSKIIIKKNNSLDVRSYRLYAGKLLKKGFKPKRDAETAINDIIKKFKDKKILRNETNYRSLYLSKLLSKKK